MEQFVIVCPLVFLAGFVDSIAGGGGLISFPAYLLAGVPVHVILGTSKLSSFPGSIVAAARFGKSGFIRWKLAVPCGILAAAGAFAGAKIALGVEETIIKSLMIVVLPIVAFYVLRGKKTDEKETEELPFKTLLILGAAVSLVIGMYDGFYGPGTGTFLILAFTGLLKMGTRDAAGISKFVNLAADIGALLTFGASGKVNVVLGVVAALFCMAGSYFGSGLVVNNGQKVVRPVILTVLALLFVRVLAG